MQPTDLIRLRDTCSEAVQDEAVDLFAAIESAYDATVWGMTADRIPSEMAIVMPPPSPKAISVARVIRINGTITFGVRVGDFAHVDHPGYEIIAATGHEVRELMRGRRQIFDSVSVSARSSEAT